MNADRRRFLAGIGAFAVAGCLGSDGDGSGPPEQVDSPDVPDDGADDGTADERTVAVIVQPDPVALREAQLEIRERLDAGEIDEREAERELAERELELIREAIDDTRGFIDDVGATHLDTVEAEGTLLVRGTPAEIVDLLSSPLITAILNEARFDQARERQQRAEDGNPPVGNETEADGNGTETEN